MRVLLRGGLGNQLFGWAAGFSLATKHNARLILVTDRIRRTDFGVLDPRDYELDYFGQLSATSTFSKLIEKAGTTVAERPEKTGFLKPRRLFREAGFSFDSRFDSLAVPITLDGYFQSWKYFRGLEAQITSHLTLGASLSPRAESIVASFGDRPWIGIHIRRGDYTKIGTMTLPGYRYYEEATNYVRSIIGASKTIVFSDDIALARNVFPEADRYIGPDELPKAGDVLMTLARSDGLVAANSTLSWWAAFLNLNKSAPKIFPDKWFTDPDLDTRDLLPSEWRTITLG